MDQATLASQKQANGRDEGAFKLADALYAAVATQVPVTEAENVEYTAEIEETVDTTTTLGQGQSASEAKAAVNEAVCLDTLACTVSASAETGRLRRRLQSTLYTSFRMYLYPLTGGTAAVGESVGDMVQAALAAGGGAATNSVKTALKAIIFVKTFLAKDASGVDDALSNTAAIEEAVNAAFCGGASCTTVTVELYAPPPPPPPSPSQPDDDTDDDDGVTVILVSTLGGALVLLLCIGLAVYIYFKRRFPRRSYQSEAERRSKYKPRGYSDAAANDFNERPPSPPMYVVPPPPIPYPMPRWSGPAEDDALAAIVVEPVRAPRRATADGAGVLEASRPLDRQRRQTVGPSAEAMAAERIQGWRRRSSVRTRSLDPGGEGSVELSHPKRPSPEPLLLAGAGGGAAPGRRRCSTRPGGAAAVELQPTGRRRKSSHSRPETGDANVFEDTVIVL